MNRELKAELKKLAALFLLAVLIFVIVILKGW
jgi:hypothetical protein